MIRYTWVRLFYIISYVLYIVWVYIYLGELILWHGTSRLCPNNSWLRSTIPHGAIPILTTRPVLCCPSSSKASPTCFVTPTGAEGMRKKGNIKERKKKNVSWKKYLLYKIYIYKEVSNGKPQIYTSWSKHATHDTNSTYKEQLNESSCKFVFGVENNSIEWIKLLATRAAWPPPPIPHFKAHSFVCRYYCVNENSIYSENYNNKLRTTKLRFMN